MFHGIGGLNPKKMQQMMKQLGINSEEIEAKRVIIEKSNGRIVIENPDIQKITTQGQESWQIIGEAREEAGGINEDDIQFVIEKTGKEKELVKRVLEETQGDVAETILKLTE